MKTFINFEGGPTVDASAIDAISQVSPHGANFGFEIFLRCGKLVSAVFESRECADTARVEVVKSWTGQG